MMWKNAFFLFVFATALWACTKTDSEQANPPAEGFDLAHSDPAAIELADSIMLAMGGRENWDKTRFISWNFSGVRNLVWDKQKGRVRIESQPDSTIYLVDLNSVTGRVQIKGQELTEADSLKKMLQRGKSIWIKDSYWLVMPFKLKDSGVTLRYLGEDTLKTGGKCNVLELTFHDDEGDTFGSKYYVFVDLNDNLVKQWAYFESAEQDTATFTRPWDNYQKYGAILLSGDRSDDTGPKNVSVEQNIAEKTFTEF